MSVLGPSARRALLLTPPCRSFVGALGGFFTVFAAGSVYYRDAAEGGKLIALPLGLYVGGDDYSVLLAFFAAPLGSLGWTLASAGARIGVMWLLAKRRGEAFVLERREWNTAEFALPEDRPVVDSREDSIKGA